MSLGTTTSEERYRRLFESAPIGIALVDENRVIGDSNPALEDMPGRSHAELLGQDIRSFVAAGETPSFQDRLRQMAHGELDVARWGRKFAKPDGESLWTRQTTSAVRDENGAFLYGIRMVEDIT